MCQALLKALGQSGDQDSQGSLISGDLGSSEGRPSACAHTQMSQATANGMSAVRWQRDVAVRNLGVVSWSLWKLDLKKETGCGKSCGKWDPGRGNCKDKGPEAGTSFCYWKDRKAGQCDPDQV